MAVGVRRRRAEPPARSHGALPVHLPRYEVVIDIESRDCPCCGVALTPIGELRTEQLDIAPCQLRVRVTRRPRYACRSCDDVVAVAPAPDRPVDGGMPTEALIAHVVASKFADAQPLYRQVQILSRQGVTLDRSTLANWAGRACWWLQPLYDLLVGTVLASPKVFADDTTLPVLEPGRGRTKTGRLWCYAVDDRPWCGPGHPVAVYAYSEDRKGERPAGHLAGFAGVLQVDGYAGFKRLAGDRADGSATLAFCWSHAIRTQSLRTSRPLVAGVGLRLAQRDDMLDLDMVVVDDDALDDQLQDRLPLGDVCALQPCRDAPAERRQAVERLVRVQPPLAQAA
jgi:transposase